MMENDHNDATVLTVKRKRMMIFFIEATRELLLTEGVDGLSIRKIATKAGYNSATIYNYFQDLEHLTLFGSVCYLRDYVASLAKSLTPEMNSLERFRMIYRCFNDIAFRNPDIFHNLFFGRRSEMLGDVLHTYYYDLFPEELSGISSTMRQMMISGSMRERDYVTMQAMVQEGFVAPEKADITLDLIIATHQTFIYEACLQGDRLDIQTHKQKFMQLFEYLLDAAK
ncbi:TetR/AcrR family transcriptional regulator [Faecalispora anaeroviscerum]|uniref:TetR/AcrR family transcriptional regulator n=1 Tax=Faecalispora anaeroviscerum TaxID=2991836 RepID=UPI0024BB968B|nr:TetR/AcrR family transcriptional regulator [Faecalispora anaeroviscerum]